MQSTKERPGKFLARPECVGLLGGFGLEVF